MSPARFALSALLTASLLAACGDGPSGGEPSGGGPSESPTNSGGPVVTTPALLESLPLDLASIDYAAVLKFADQYTNGSFPIADFGDGIEGTDVAGARLNPQPTFWAPIGTPVLAPITGVIVNVQEIYSGDFTIMYAPTGAGIQGPVWETEHVLNPTVKVGDSVTAGQPVAEVSDYECFYSKEKFGNDTLCNTGLGLVELGYLVGGTVPTHYCPFGEYTSPAALPTITAQLDAARALIESIRGKNYFKQDAWATPNCIVLDGIEG